MSRLTEIVRFLRIQSYKLHESRSILQKVRLANGASVEEPFFQIEGPEYISIGENSSIGKHSWLACYDQHNDQRFDPKLLIGTNVRIGNYACLTSIDEIRIGDGCLFSDFIYISDHSHQFDPEITTPLDKNPLEAKGRVIIGSNSFLGMRVSILPNVSLGNNCVVGAHSVVTKSFPPYSMVAGVPAKRIRAYSFERKQWVVV